MSRRTPTIVDVAARAGVAIGTVSNVLNGTEPVSPFTEARVRKAIEDLGYIRNPLAQGLRRRSSTVVGLCVPHTSVAYFAKLVEAFESVASSRGFQIMQTLSHEDPEVEFRRVTSLLNHRVGGVILVPSLRPDATLEAIAASGIPLVVVDRPVAGGRFDQVTFDNRSAMTAVAQHLIGLGHRSILFVVRIRRLATTRQRIASLRAAARKIQADVTILEVGHEPYETVAAQLGTILLGSGRPTAVIASNSVFAAYMMRGFEELCLRCPRDLSLLAFDEPEWADLVTPKLAVVRQPTAEVARLGWELLIRRMHDPNCEQQIIELKAEIAFRASVGRPPVRAPRP